MRIYTQFETVEEGWFATRSDTGGLYGLGETRAEAAIDLVCTIRDWDRVRVDSE